MMRAEGQRGLLTAEETLKRMLASPAPPILLKDLIDDLDAVVDLFERSAIYPEPVPVGAGVSMFDVHR